MFETLSGKLTNIFDKIRGRGFLNEDDINSSLREIRIALLEADVAVPAVKVILEKVKEKSLGKEVLKSISPGQMIIKFVHEELIEFLGEEVPINTNANSPFSYMFVGLQGAGKTTSVAKVANLLKGNHKILLVSLDVYRPAAKEQLKILADSIGVKSLEIIENEKPVEIAKRAIDYAKKTDIDIIMFDTAGRNHIDEKMMDEVSLLQKKILPVETILVADSMTGQDAVNIAKSFKEKIDLTGLFLTRVDGDSRGGAAISMRYVTNCPIKFLGIGEHINKIMEFSPKRIADQILDKGDVIALIDKTNDLLKNEKVDKLDERVMKGKFNMNDMKGYIEQIQKFGGIHGVLNMLPGAKKIKSEIEKKSFKLPDDRLAERQLAFISSMTEKERKNTDILNGSRRKRIAAGAGQSVAELNKFLKMYEQMRKASKMYSKSNKFGMKNMLKGLKI